MHLQFVFNCFEDLLLLVITCNLIALFLSLFCLIVFAYAPVWVTTFSRA